MKKKLQLLTFLFILCSSISLSAQLSAGGGMNYETGLERIGFTAKLKYIFNEEEWAASPSYTIYPSDGASVSVIDLDAHYQFATLFANDMSVYALGGLGFVNYSNEFVDAENNNIALNGGIGVSIPTASSWNIFAELKLRLNDGLGNQIGGGVMYQF